GWSCHRSQRPSLAYSLRGHWVPRKLVRRYSNRELNRCAICSLARSRGAHDPEVLTMRSRTLAMSSRAIIAPRGNAGGIRTATRASDSREPHSRHWDNPPMTTQRTRHIGYGIWLIVASLVGWWAAFQLTLEKFFLLENPSEQTSCF